MIGPRPGITASLCCDHAWTREYFVEVRDFTGMHGWRGRIGLIVPSTNTVNEPEFYRYLPPGVTLHTARIPYDESRIENQTEMIDQMQPYADDLVSANVDVLVFGCTTGSLVKGSGHETAVENTLADIGNGIPGIATAASILRAFDALALHSLSVVTPYPEELDDREVSFLEESGREVVTIGGPGVYSGEEKGNYRPETVYRLATEFDSPEADGVFISCTNFRTAEIIADLERDLGKPVVSSNQATLWDTLRTLNVEYADIDLGALYDE